LGGEGKKYSREYKPRRERSEENKPVDVTRSETNCPKTSPIRDFFVK
jgi:hypothetical protein